jgi:zinc finger protein 830
MARLKDEERHNEAWKEEPRVQGKRKIEEKDHHPDDEESKRPKVGTETTGTGDSGLFPTDFFSDPSQGPLPPTSDNSDDEGAMARSHIAPANHEASVLDLEWEKFQRDVLNESDHRETYERATVFAEPIIVAETQEEGFPKHQSKDTEPVQVNDEEARRKREQDDRELIMDRLLDEERAQEEADLKVVVIKGRLDALKERRQAAKAAKSK